MRTLLAAVLLLLSMVVVPSANAKKPAPPPSAPSLTVFLSGGIVHVSWTGADIGDPANNRFGRVILQDSLCGSFMRRTGQASGTDTWSCNHLPASGRLVDRFSQVLATWP